MTHLKEKLRKEQLLHHVHFQDISAEGMGIGRTTDNIVVFCNGAIPEDIAHVKIQKIKGSYVIGNIDTFVQLSPYRTAPFCSHFGICGGCKWQYLSYQAQLHYKKKFIYDALTRIAHLPIATIHDMPSPLPSPHIQYYRNKLEFTFSPDGWIPAEYFSKENKTPTPALGFHIHQKYDRVIDIQQCFLQHPLSNDIRNFIKAYAIQNNIPFYNIKTKQGLLRTLIIRHTTLNEWMVILGVYEVMPDILFPLLDAVYQKFPFIQSLQYAHLFMLNDSLNNGIIHLYKGRDYIVEQLGHLKFKISANSFFQTNSLQTKQMYDIVKDLAALTGKEIVYDLYCGTGTISLYVANQCNKVVGIEYVPQAIEDAKQNAILNNIHHVEFFAGDIKHVLNDEFINIHGTPDVIITDPPRAGMHKDVIYTIKKIAPKRIVYVSCNPPSQARDITYLLDKYTVTYIQPIDMFPHTTHIENILLLERKE